MGRFTEGGEDPASYFVKVASTYTGCVTTEIPLRKFEYLREKRGFEAVASAFVKRATVN